MNPRDIASKAERHAPVSPSQEGILFLDQLLENSAYNTHFALRLGGDLDVGALERALATIVERHESLRTYFSSEGFEFVQRVRQFTDFTLSIEDLEAIDDREEFARQRAVEISTRLFAVRRGPLFRFVLLRLHRQLHLLVLATHHLVSDGWSTGILLQELSRAYSKLSRGDTIKRFALERQYTDYAQWQISRLKQPAMLAQLERGVRRLEGASPTGLPYGNRARSDTGLGRVSQSLPEEVVKRLGQLAKGENCSLFTLFSAALAGLLSMASEETDVTLGTVAANRLHPQWQNSIGLFANTVLLRIDLSGRLSLRELVRRTARSLRATLGMQEIPFERVAQRLARSETTPRQQVLRTLLVSQNLQSSPIELPGLQSSALRIPGSEAKVDLVVAVTETSTNWTITFEFDTTLYDELFCKTNLAHFGELLAAMGSDPDAMLSPTLLDVPSTSQKAPSRISFTETVYESFQAIALRRPDATAVVFGNQSLSYRSLQTTSARMANALCQLELPPESIIGIHLEKGIGQVVAMLGVLRAGAAFAPLDRSQPGARIDSILENSEIGIVIGDEETEIELANHSVKVVSIDRFLEFSPEEAVSLPRKQVHPLQLAYVIYTSGSTGIPKGVQVSQTAFCNLSRATLERYSITETDRVLQFATFGFDASIWQVFMALHGGAVCVLPTMDVREGADYLYQFFRREQITAADLPPVMVDRMPETGLPALHTLSVGGEVCPRRTIRRWAPTRRFMNVYGPTECTVACTWHDFRKEDAEQRHIPTGKPIPHASVYIAGSTGELLPQGWEGELHIGGIPPARGYQDSPALTAEKFVPDLMGTPGARAYRSGDRACLDHMGVIEFRGRADGQIQLRGYRIELGEIEAALIDHPDISEAAALLDDSHTNRARIIGFYCCRERDEVAQPAVIRARLEHVLPPHMIPALLVPLAHLPRVQGDKLDRKALQSHAAKFQPPTHQHVEPRDEFERALRQEWAEVLGVEANTVSVEDDFTLLGGNSLHIMDFAQRIREHLGFELKLREIFDSSTIARLAETITKKFIANHRKLGDSEETASL